MLASKMRGINFRLKKFTSIAVAAGTSLGLLLPMRLLLPPANFIEHGGVTAGGGRSRRALYSTAKGVGSERAKDGVDLPQFRTYNPHEDWCPDAVCKNSPLCRPCDRRFLFLISTGRSGSTSLMSMINLLPGVRLSGENNNILRALGETVSTFANHPRSGMWRQVAPGEKEPDDPIRWKDGNSRDSWGHNRIPPGSLSCPVQHMVEAINPPPLAEQLRGTAGTVNDTDIIGFKTIRFLEGWADAKDGSSEGRRKQYSLKDPLDFLLENFPCSRVVVNIRSNERELERSWQSTSRYMRDDISGVELQEQTQLLRSLVERLGSRRVKLMDVIEWGSNTKKFNELAEWLGFKSCFYPEVLHSHADNGFFLDERDVKLDSRCQYVGTSITNSTVKT